ncbi:MAG: hypothetical protein AAF830_12780 [Pseudomonadota bacterium]
MLKELACLAACLAVGVLAPAHANLVRLQTDFTASDFYDFLEGTEPIPVQTVFGSLIIEYDRSILMEQTPTNIAFSMTVGSVVYNLTTAVVDEVFIFQDPDFEFISAGGLITGPRGSAPFTDDFNMSFNLVTMTGGVRYRTANTFGAFQSREFELLNTTITASEVPVPGVGLIVALPLAIGAIRRGRTN